MKLMLILLLVCSFISAVAEMGIRGAPKAKVEVVTLNRDHRVYSAWNITAVSTSSVDRFRVVHGTMAIFDLKNQTLTRPATEFQCRDTRTGQIVPQHQFCFDVTDYLLPGATHQVLLPPSCRCVSLPDQGRAVIGRFAVDIRPEIGKPRVKQTKDDVIVLWTVTESPENARRYEVRFAEKGQKFETLASEDQPGLDPEYFVKVPATRLKPATTYNVKVVAFGLLDTVNAESEQTQFVSNSLIKRTKRSNCVRTDDCEDPKKMCVDKVCKRIPG